MTASTSAPTTGWIQVSAERGDRPTRRAGSRRRRQQAARAVRSTSSRSTGRTGGSPTRRTAASTRPRPATAGPRLRDHRRRAALDRTSPANLPDVPVNTSCSTRPTRRRSTSAPTSARSSRTTAAAAGTRSAPACPKVAVWQLDYDATNGVLAAGTHGRGAYTMYDRRATAGARGVQGRHRRAGRAGQHGATTRSRCATSATPTRPSVRRSTDPIPAHTKLAVSVAGRRLLHRAGTCEWDGLTVPAGGSVTLHFTVRIDTKLPASVHGDHERRHRREGGRGQHVRPPAARTTPRSRRRTRVSVSPGVGHRGRQGRPDRDVHRARDQRGLPHRQLHVSASGGLERARCTTRRARRRSPRRRRSRPGDTADVCVKVAVPADAAEQRHQRHDASTATSVEDPTVSASATLTAHGGAVRHAAGRQRHQRPGGLGAVLRGRAGRQRRRLRLLGPRRGPGPAGRRTWRAHRTSCGSPATPTRARSRRTSRS